LALDLLAEKAERLLVLQTLTMPSDDELQTPKDLPFERREALLEQGWPAMAFIEHKFAADELVGAEQRLRRGSASPQQSRRRRAAGIPAVGVPPHRAAGRRARRA